MRLARLYAILGAVLAMLEGCCMNTRKGFIRDGFGLAAIIAAQSAPAILVRSMVAARNGIAAAKRGWVNPYVTDGLVAMWDGEWNAGGGVHDANTPSWCDLSGNGHDLIVDTEKVSFGENYMQMVAGADECAYNTVPLDVEVFTICATWKSATAGGYNQGRVLSTGSPLRRGIGTRSAKWINGGNARTSEFGGNNSLYYEYNLQNRIWTYSDNESYFGSLYVNGTQYSFQSVIVSTINNDVGYLQFSSPNISRLFYNISLYSRVLTAAEIAANYTIDKARFNLA